MIRFFPVLTSEEMAERIHRECTPDRIGILYAENLYLVETRDLLREAFGNRVSFVMGAILLHNAKVYFSDDPDNLSTITADFVIVQQGRRDWESLERRTRGRHNDEIRVDTSGSSHVDLSDRPVVDCDDVIFGGTGS